MKKTLAALAALMAVSAFAAVQAPMTSYASDAFAAVQAPMTSYAPIAFVSGSAAPQRLATKVEAPKMPQNVFAAGAKFASGTQTKARVMAKVQAGSSSLLHQRVVCV